MARKLWKWAIAVVLLCLFLVAGCLYLFWIALPRTHVPSAKTAGIPFPAAIAHRGASYLAPEETEPAYILARDLGADYLELDIQRTKDHVLVAMHDDSVARTTDAAKVFPGREKDNVEQFTLSELKQLDAGSWFNKTYPHRARAKYAGVKILTLDEIIAIAEGGTNKPSIYIETKSPELHPGYEQELVDLLRQKGWLGKFESGRSKVIFQSFYIASLQRLKDLAPEVPRVYLFNDTLADRYGWDTLIQDAASLCSGIGPAGNICWPWNLAKAHNAGLAIHIYTIDPISLVRLLTFFGADGFFTNRCDLLLGYYGRPPALKPEDILATHGY